jgi:hypothetical protein
VRKSRTNIDEVLVSLVGCWLLLERRKSHKHLSQEPTGLWSHHNACPIFEGVSRRIFGARFCNNWIYIDEVLASVAAPCSSLSVEIVARMFLKNQLGFGASLTSAQYSMVYQDATFEPVSVTIGSILVKFLLMWLVVVCCFCCCCCCGVMKIIKLTT